MRDAVATWVDGYVRAWRSNDPAEVGALFADDASYVARPGDPAVAGRDAIVAWWLEHADGPDDATFDYEVVGVDGRRGFVRGVTAYRADGEEPARVYENLWMVDLDDDGLATAFTEWFVRRRERP